VTSQGENHLIIRESEKKRPKWTKGVETRTKSEQGGGQKGNICGKTHEVKKPKKLLRGKGKGGELERGGRESE